MTVEEAGLGAGWSLYDSLKHCARYRPCCSAALAVGGSGLSGLTVFLGVKRNKSKRWRQRKVRVLLDLLLLVPTYMKEDTRRL